MIPYATSIKYMIGGYSVIFVMLAIYLTQLDPALAEDETGPADA